MDVQCDVPGAQELEWPQGAMRIGQLTRKRQPGTSQPMPSRCEELKLGKSQHREVREAEADPNTSCPVSRTYYAISPHQRQPARPAPRPLPLQRCCGRTRRWRCPAGWQCAGATRRRAGVRGSGSPLRWTGSGARLGTGRGPPPRLELGSPPGLRPLVGLPLEPKLALSPLGPELGPPLGLVPLLGPPGDSGHHCTSQPPKKTILRCRPQRRFISHAQPQKCEGNACTTHTPSMGLWEDKRAEKRCPGPFSRETDGQMGAPQG